MPVETNIQRLQPTEERFQALDYKVMAQAFSIHNTLGKLHDESVYQTALTQRCSELSLNPIRELPLKVTHGTFSKYYYLDICVNGEAIYELKTVDRISTSHASQLLNYLFLSELPYGKIINFRNQSVESRFVSTYLTPSDRRNFKTNTEEWTARSRQCESIPNLIESLLEDWGTHLDIHLYREAIQHLLNLNKQSTINIYDKGILIGTRNETLLSPETSLHISSIKESLTPYRNHLLRLFSHTELKYIQWINFAGSEISLLSLENAPSNHSKE